MLESDKIRQKSKDIKRIKYCWLWNPTKSNYIHEIHEVDFVIFVLPKLITYLSWGIFHVPLFWFFLKHLYQNELFLALNSIFTELIFDSSCSHRNFFSLAALPRAIYCCLIVFLFFLTTWAVIFLNPLFYLPKPIYPWSVGHFQIRFLLT